MGSSKFLLGGYMPLLDVECKECGVRKEVLVPTTTAPVICNCGRIMNTLITAPNFELKGTGWFKDGYSK